MRVLRWSAGILGVLLAGVSLTVVGAVTWARTEDGQAWILAKGLEAAQPARGSLEIGGLRTNLWSNLHLDAVSLKDSAGKELVGLDSLDAEFTLEIFKKTVRVSRLNVAGLRADLAMTDKGLDVASLWGEEDPVPTPSTPYSGLPITLFLDQVSIEASALKLVSGEEIFALTDAGLTGGLAFEGDQIAIRSLALDAATTTPELGALALRTDLVYGPDALQIDVLDLKAGAQHVTVKGRLGALSGDDPTAVLHIEGVNIEPEQLPWSAPIAGIFSFTGETSGTFGAPTLLLQAQTPGGPFELRASLDTHPTRPTWTAVVLTHSLALHEFITDLDPLVLDARIETNGAGLGWPDDLDAHAVLLVSTPDIAGAGATSVAGTVDLSKGVALISGLNLGTPTGTAIGEGRVDIVGSKADLKLSSLDVALADLKRFGVGGLGGRVHFVGGVAADWSGENPDVKVGGVFSGRGIRYQETARIEALHGPVHVRLRNGALSVASAFDARGISGAVAGDTASGRISLKGDSLDASLDLFKGERTLIGVDAAGDLGTKTFTLPRLILSPDETQTWVGAGEQTVTLADDGFDELRLAISSGDAALMVAGALHTEGAVNLAITAEDFPIEMLAGLSPPMKGYAGTLNLAGAMGGSARALQLALNARVDALVAPGVIHDVDVSLGVLGGEGRVAVDAALSMSGADPQVLATVKGEVPLFLDLRDPVFSPTKPVDLLLDVPTGAAGRWTTVLDGDVPTMRGSGQLALTGTPLEPDLALVATVEMPARESTADWIGLDLKLANISQALTLDAALRQGETVLAALNGSATVHLDDVSAAAFGRGPAVDMTDPGVWADDLDFTLVPVDLTAESVAKLKMLPRDVAGALLGAVHVKGSPRAPQIDGALWIEGGKIDDLDITKATLDLAGETGGYLVALDLGFGSEGDLKVEAHVPLDLSKREDLAGQINSPGLNVVVSGAGIPLHAVSALMPDLRQASGRVKLEGSVTGSLAAPVANLRASAKDAVFELGLTGVAYDEVNFDLVLSPTALRLDGLHVRTSEPGSKLGRGFQGSLDANLAAALNGTTLGDWRGEINFDRTLVMSTGDTLLRLAPGKVTLSGTPPNVVVNGEILVEEASFHLDDRFFVGRTDTTLPTWLHVNRVSSAPKAEAVLDEDTGVPDWLELGLNLNLARNLFLHAEIPIDDSLGGLLGPFGLVTLDTQVDGQLDITAQEGQLSVEGQILPLRGTTVLFGRPFELSDDSMISFTGRDFSSPILDLRATYDARSYGLVEAHISGIPAALTVELSSDDYPAQDDVISLLLVGKPASEMTAGEGTADTATSAAMSMLLSAVGQQVGRQGAAAAAIFLAPDLLVVGASGGRVGKRIGNRIFVMVDVDNTADDIKTSFLVITVEIALGGPWEGEFVHGTAGLDAIGVNWTKRY